MLNFCRILLIRKDTNSPPGKKFIYGATVHFQTDIVSFFECFNPRCPKIVPIAFCIAFGNHGVDNNIVYVEVNLSAT